MKIEDLQYLKYEADSDNPRKWLVSIEKDDRCYRRRFFTERAAKMMLEKWKTKFSL